MTSKPPTKIFPITEFLSDLPTNLTPQFLAPSSENGLASGRLVIVGDVHGMRKSLEALLDKVGFNKNKGDYLILVGDLVNKGSDSPGVVDLAIKLGASAVRGNHENAVLNAAAAINAPKEILQGDLTGSLAVPENQEADLSGGTVRDPEISNKSLSTTIGMTVKPSPATHSTALALSKHQLDWLAALPLILRVKLPPGLSPSLGDTLVVAHAGLVPGIPLEEQNPHAVMHVRSLVRKSDEDGFMPAEVSGEESWVGEWDRWQDKLASKTTVVFGHDAKRRLQLGKYAIGLDSGCLYGNQLSAVVIAVVDGQIERQIVQVECIDEPVAPTVSVDEGDKKVMG
ncbi:hypothetical protein N7520_011467 [Penicillium odoratum]|uniref:uncharacterized protein n=1 Tax=Penicillium odoratum TaxID=1167516 RepID=UPI0025473A9B|nr:uncharacterized protein N7520_011467 [Penicillium odoratum]KAJ5746285.1 hypothetical protein N7520_011467 [Penicillium odoratum]